MKQSILSTLALASILCVLAIGCAQDTKSNATRYNSNNYRGSCNPNFPASCNTQNYGMNYGGSQCGMNAVATQYGCLPQGNCPVNYGYLAQYNQCVQGSTQYNNGYNQNYYNNGYNQNYYNNGTYNNGYNNYNGYNGYNQNSYYGY